MSGTVCAPGKRLGPIKLLTTPPTIAPAKAPTGPSKAPAEAPDDAPLAMSFSSPNQLPCGFVTSVPTIVAGLSCDAPPVNVGLVLVVAGVDAVAVGVGL